jgi:hypothetical protein
MSITILATVFQCLLCLLSPHVICLAIELYKGLTSDISFLSNSHYYYYYYYYYYYVILYMQRPDLQALTSYETTFLVFRCFLYYYDIIMGRGKTHFFLPMRNSFIDWKIRTRVYPRSQGLAKEGWFWDWVLICFFC